MTEKTLHFLMQCGNFKVFLSVRFYVKSILEAVKVQNLPFSLFLGLRIFNVGKFQTSETDKNHKNQNSELSNVLKWFWISKILEIDFTENQSDRKIMKFSQG